MDALQRSVFGHVHRCACMSVEDKDLVLFAGGCTSCCRRQTGGSSCRLGRPTCLLFCSSLVAYAWQCGCGNVDWCSTARTSTIATAPTNASVGRQKHRVMLSFLFCNKKGRSSISCSRLTFRQTFRWISSGELSSAYHTHGVVV